jgi:hypothetical protein
MLSFRKGLLAVTAALAVLAFGVLAPQQADATAGSLSNYLANKLIDFTLRGQTFTAPATVWVALATTTGSPAACGTEVATGSYARVSVTTSLTNFSGTQSAGSTAVSSGTNAGSGLTFSNNGTVTFPAPTANWGTVTEFCVFDASTAGNLLFRAALTTSKTINSGDAAPSFAISALSGTVN